MKSVDLNFATTPFRNNTPYVLGYGLGILALGAFTLYNGWAYSAYSQSRAELETERQGKKAKIEALYQDAARIQGLIRQKNIDAMNARAAFTNSLLEKRRFSWTDLLNSLEEVQPYQVRLLSLLPLIQDKGIIIQARGVAKDLKDFNNFQQNLQSHPKFRRAYPGGFVRNSDAGEYIFNLAFNYFPDGAPAGVQGLTPDEIVEAPGGDGDSPAPPQDEDGAQSGPGAGGRVPERARKTPGSRPGAPTAQGRQPSMLNPGSPQGNAAVPPNSANVVNGANGANPINARPIVNPGAKPLAQDGRSAQGPPASGPVTIGTPAGTAAVPGTTPNTPYDPNAPKKARWQGRGAPLPGMAPPPRAPLPGNTVPATVTPHPTDPDPDDDEPDPDDDGTEDRS